MEPLRQRVSKAGAAEQRPAAKSRTRWRRALGIGLAAALGLALTVAVALRLGEGRWPLADGPPTAPDVVFSTIDGAQVELAALRGKVVLVDFWATSCAICLREMPQIAGIHRRLQARGLATVAVAMPYDRADFVLHYARSNALPFPVALDPMGRVTSSLGPVRGTPTLILIDRAGRIVQRWEGEVDASALERRIERELGEAPAAAPNGPARRAPIRPA